MKIVIKNIQQLVQVQNQALPERLRCGSQMRHLPVLDNAYLITQDDRIDSFGPMDRYNPQWEAGSDRILDATGKFVLPSFCDAHTHLVYAGSREREFMDKIRGLSYQEIAARGGGILNSARLLQQTSPEELFDQTLPRVEEIIGFGTGAVEIKSGYGLTPEDELKMLKVIRRIKEQTPLQVKATFLGAHAVPAEYKGRKKAYVDLIISRMIPMVADQELAQYIDIFCEDGFFSVEDAQRLFEAGARYGLRPRVHANQMSFSGGVQVGVQYDAITVDHLEHTAQAEWDALAASRTIPVLLPGATFFMEMEYAPARKMLERGLPLAIASNYNPGSCPSGNLFFMMFLACLKMKLHPEEALNATTLNGACAMDVDDDLGAIAVGKRANLFITKKIPSVEYLAYAFNSPMIDTLILNGKLI